MESALERAMIDYAAGLRFDELSPPVLHHAKRRVIDTIAGALAACESAPARIARRLAPEVAKGRSARLFGSLARTSPEMAAFANGVMARFLDINDTHRTIDGSHPSDNLSGVLAVGEDLGASGRDFLLALTISYEIQCRFVDSVPFNDNGWDQPVPGVMACALACGRLLGLDREALRHALALAVIPNLCTYQTRAGELSMWKGCAAANGARQGVFAAYLAAEGMTGPYEAFDGVFGLWNQTLGKPFEVKPFARAGDAFAVTQTNIKKFPVRDSCQLPVETALALRAAVAANDIEKLRVVTYRSAHKGAVADPELWRPRTRETADHSMPVSIALALIDGDITGASFDRERFRDDDVLALIGRTEVVVSNEFSSQTPGVRNCRLEATDKTGETHVAHLAWTAEDIARGPGDDEIEDKFHRYAGVLLGPPERTRLLERLWRLESVDDVADILPLTAA
ncbi:MAG: MmgE/PrpD family protein [Chromatiales bacterium]|nr:MmgE/PrpD family protein [Chromatiales bacterium]